MRGIAVVATEDNVLVLVSCCLSVRLFNCEAVLCIHRGMVLSGGKKRENPEKSERGDPLCLSYFFPPSKGVTVQSIESH